ncbi:MAG: Dabb family protein [Bacteroidales bacterium]|nr:Dabb family protein [Bacteroidales bacterium]MDD3167343.1 Dabb family protein [Bacteroidales bacterium]MDD4771355.1 Dabb family protein [Bacteroidales bacterium]
MIKHLVFWKLKSEALGKTKQENAVLIKEKLEALDGKISGLISIEVGIDYSATPASSDVALLSVFSDRASLDAYQTHPLHEAVREFIVQVVSDRHLVDYEC